MLNKKWLINYFILSLLGIFSSIIIRFDYIFKILSELPYELMLSIRLASALYNILIIFLLIINIKYCIELIKLYYNNILKNIKTRKVDKSIMIIYMLYFIFILIVTIILSIFNYYSILSLNIVYLDFIYIISSIISLILGIYCSASGCGAGPHTQLNVEIDLNKSLSLTGKICFVSFILIYVSLFIGIRSGGGAIIFDFLNKFELFGEIHCDTTSPNNESLNNRLRSGAGEDSISTITNNSGSNIGNTRSSISSSINVGDNATASNITINPNNTPNNNQPTIIATRTVSTTETIISPSSAVNNSSSSATVNSNLNNPLLDNGNPPRYTNNNNSLNLIEKGKSVVRDSVGIFTDSNSPLFSNSSNDKLSQLDNNSLLNSNKAVEDSSSAVETISFITPLIETLERNFINKNDLVKQIRDLKYQA